MSVRVIPSLVCPNCGSVFHRPPSHRARNAAAYCSRSCRAKIATAPILATHAHKAYAARTEGGHRSYLLKMSGPNNPAWKGGITYRKRHGNYVSVRYVRCPADFISMARKDGYVMEHRLVMARWVGRPLLRVEVVHHADHAPLNNPRSNLELWPDNRSHKIAEYGRVPEGAANLWP